MKAQRFKGEIQARLGDKDLVLVADMNALADFEEAAGVPAMVFFGAMERGAAHIRHTRLFLHAAMLRHWPEATVHDAGDLLSEDTTVVVRLLNAAMPAAEGGEGNGKAPA